MSHWVKVTTEIKDLDALRTALQAIDKNYKLVEDAVARGHENKECDWVIKLNGHYDVGLKRGVGFDAPWELQLDSWGGHVQRELGENCSKLLQQYSLAVIKRQARRGGMTVSEKRLEDGTIELEVHEQASY